MTVQITILGLGQIGTSIGLALSEHKDLVRRIGNDADNNIARQAEKMGAIDQVIFNLPSAVRQADLVILALPVDEIKEVLEIISQDLKEGVVIIDTSPAKEKVAEWAAELLPAERHLVGWTPTIHPNYLFENTFGIEAAHADLFKDCLIFITTPPETIAPAIKLASDLTTLVGGKPFFADVSEVDGLVAATTLLPQLTAIALTNTVVDQPGWREGRKISGSPFAMGTAPLQSIEGKKDIAQAARHNRENMVRLIDTMVASLSSIRQAIQEDDAETINNWMNHALEERSLWISQRKSNDWNRIDHPTTPLPTASEVLGRLVGIRKGKPNSKDRKK
jgi:prephenate dehydrogenase